MSETKYIFVTGGVVSSIGKGTSAAALGMLLKSRGYRVVLQKFDPYINVCLLYTSPSPRDRTRSRMPSSA